jgi:hypothetical protein
VVESLAAALRRLDEDLELSRHLFLVHEVRQRRRAQGPIEVVVAARHPDLCHRLGVRRARRPLGEVGVAGDAHAGPPAP